MLGTPLGAVLGDWLGPLLGTELGASLGRVLAATVGTKEDTSTAVGECVRVLGVELGVLLGSKLGIILGNTCVLGSTLGVVRVEPQLDVCTPLSRYILIMPKSKSAESSFKEQISTTNAKPLYRKFEYRYFWPVTRAANESETSES